MKFAEILQHRIMTRDSRMGINLAQQLSFVPRAQWRMFEEPELSVFSGVYRRWLAFVADFVVIRGWSTNRLTGRKESRCFPEDNQRSSGVAAWPSHLGMTRDLKNTNYVNTHASRLLGTARLVWVILRAPNSCRTEVLNRYDVNYIHWTWLELHLSLSTIDSKSIFFHTIILLDLCRIDSEILSDEISFLQRLPEQSKTNNNMHYVQLKSIPPVLTSLPRFLLDKQECRISFIYRI